MKKTFLIITLLACAGVFAYLFLAAQARVEARFQGRPWELPARVYARPLEIYAGMHLDPDLFEKELAFMNYQALKAGSRLTTPGTWSRQGDTFDLFCRSFDFGAERLAERQIQVRVEKNQVVRIKGAGPDGVARLDPVVLGSFYPASMEDRVLVVLDQVPDLLKNTLIAVEDRHFYTHYGIDPKSIFRAIWINIRDRQLTQGASTLTQQLAKNFFLTPEKTLARKVNEAFMAAALELRFTKDEILEAYLNEVFLGQDGKRAIHGFGLAAQFYFAKPLDRLAPHEIALLVGMLKGPSLYNPRVRPKKARARRDAVLNQMAGKGLISGKDLNAALAKPLGISAKPASSHSPFPFYLDLVKRQLLLEYREQDLGTMGLRIFTTLDPQIQLAAEQAVAGFLSGRSKKLEPALVVTSRATNEIWALVGGRRFRFKGFNRALDARRPIGSLVKPAVFLTALARPDAYTLMTRVEDTPVQINTPGKGEWQPRNFDRRFHGTMPLYQALVHSYNAATVRLGMALGLEPVAQTLEKLGHGLDRPLLPSLLLGSVEMTPVRIAQVYHTLASGGFHTPARAIRAIYPPGGEALQRYDLTIDQRLDPNAVFLVNTMLQAAVAQGTGKSLARWVGSDLAVAGKTGTTNDLRDSWFAGFTGSCLAVAWIGRDDNQPCGLSGATGALQVFGRLMAQIPNTPLQLAVPEGVEWAVVDPASGWLTDDTCPKAMAVPFIKGSGPERYRSCRPSPGPSKSGARNPKSPPRFMDWLREIFK